MKSKFIKFTQTEKGAQWCALLIVIVLPLILLIPYLNFFPYPAEAKYSDFTITHFPNFVYIQNSLWKFHEIPLWSDAIFSGYPFAANPLSSLFYPPAWISWILPLPMGLNLLTMLHLVFSAVGIFFFLRSENNSIMASLGGALSLELMTKLFGHLGSGHITLIWAFCWLSWILLSINKANHLPLINSHNRHIMGFCCIGRYSMGFLYRYFMGFF